MNEQIKLLFLLSFLSPRTFRSLESWASAGQQITSGRCLLLFHLYALTVGASSLQSYYYEVYIIMRYTDLVLSKVLLFGFGGRRGGRQTRNGGMNRANATDPVWEFGICYILHFRIRIRDIKICYTPTVMATTLYKSIDALFSQVSYTLDNGGRTPRGGSSPKLRAASYTRWRRRGRAR